MANTPPILNFYQKNKKKHPQTVHNCLWMLLSAPTLKHFYTPVNNYLKIIHFNKITLMLNANRIMRKNTL